MSYYHECNTCGSRLDPGERCDCEIAKERRNQNDELRKMRKTAKEPQEHGARVRA